MILWRPLVGQCLQCVKEPTNKLDKNTVAVVCTNPYCQEELVDHAQKKSLTLYPYFYPCPTALYKSLRLGDASANLHF